ncbi:MAG: hypothetical protein EZS28_024151 [Streblomastix strix]|uniref:Uncharacterized protein n=1 Tax=Streblomastix strix TaxID=222440 RepID=A0A5J4VD70_9EUKA|nr:MAG: hypothetical protein EZS28_024151 [Streblomastix strix]
MQEGKINAYGLVAFLGAYGSVSPYNGGSYPSSPVEVGISIYAIEICVSQFCCRIPIRKLMIPITSLLTASFLAITCAPNMCDTAQLSI